MSNTLDDRTFEAVFREYFSTLSLFALKYVPDMDTAKEIVHAVFLNLWEKREQMDAGKSLKAYLFTSVYNRSLNYIRDQKKFRKDAIYDITAEMMASETASEPVETSELQQQINDALGTLPAKCRQIFEMNRFEGLKYRQISDQIDISVKTVEAQISKALRILRKELKDYFLWYILVGSCFLQYLG